MIYIKPYSISSTKISVCVSGIKTDPDTVFLRIYGRDEKIKVDSKMTCTFESLEPNNLYTIFGFYIENGEKIDIPRIMLRTKKHADKSFHPPDENKNTSRPSKLFSGVILSEKEKEQMNKMSIRKGEVWADGVLVRRK